MTDHIFAKAEKDLFAIYQTIYSGADIELWLDWGSRLNDTKWTDNCYWMLHDGQKVAGAIINGNTIMYPFLIEPFCNRPLFWYLLHQHMMQSGMDLIQANGMLDKDANILITFGYKINRIRQMMCRPTDVYPISISNDFYFRIPDIANDIDEIAELIYKGFQGGKDYEVFGIPTIEKVKEDEKNMLDIMKSTDTLDHSVIVFHKETNEIAGVCIAGIDPKMPNEFSGIADICVKPKYRNMGLAKFMIEHSLNAAYKKTPVMKLCVTVGNYAENLYRRLGFVAGPKFSNMSYQNMYCRKDSM